MEPSVRARVLEKVRAGRAQVHTDPLASPTGFPFKVVQIEGTLSEADVYAARERRCDLGYLREIYRRADGTPGYRCPAEPVDDYLRKVDASKTRWDASASVTGCSQPWGLGRVGQKELSRRL